MQTFKINGYEVTIYETYYGDDVYIYKNDEKIYSARVIRGQAIERAFDVIGRQ